ncbi:MAG TPA: tetratricopeptide repeat protein [Candidatus Aquilonibacter sp.]|nr:tetratricopeptide repeat protein [Candidatus Aquilonibacter sp.]
MLRTISVCFLLLGSCCAQQAGPSPSPSAVDLVKQGEKLNSEGKQDEAIALYRQAYELAPQSYELHLAWGIALDLKGEYASARYHLSQALDSAPIEARTRVLQATAISYAFEGKSDEAARFEAQIFSVRSGNSDFNGAAETADEAGRVCLESGDPACAAKWYKVGYDTALQNPKLSDADKSLWLFRWENAQARIAARAGQPEDAQKHIAAAKLALDKANNPGQLRFYPYLTGYVAFYTGDYKTAITDLQKGDQRDPMVLALLGEACEKLGNQKEAQDYYRKVLSSNAHNPANAWARPLARKKLGG